MTLCDDTCIAYILHANEMFQYGHGPNLKPYQPGSRLQTASQLMLFFERFSVAGVGNFQIIYCRQSGPSALNGYLYASPMQVLAIFKCSAVTSDTPRESNEHIIRKCGVGSLPHTYCMYTVYMCTSWRIINVSVAYFVTSLCATEIFTEPILTLAACMSILHV